MATVDGRYKCSPQGQMLSASQTGDPWQYVAKLGINPRGIQAWGQCPSSYGPAPNSCEIAMPTYDQFYISGLMQY